MITSEERNKIESTIHRELVRSVEKHGNWDELEYPEMMDVIEAELSEAYIAQLMRDHHGDHGTFAELAQVAACCQKMMTQIIRREPVAEVL